MTNNIQKQNNNTQTKQITQTIFNDISSKDDLIRLLSSKSGFTLSDTRIFLDTFISIFEECMLFRLSIDIYGFFILSHTLISGHWGNRPYPDKPGYKEKVWIENSTRSNLKIGLNMRKLSKSEIIVTEE